MNILDNFKSILFCFHTFYVRHSIDILDSEERVKENTNSAAQRSSPESSLFKHVMVEDALRALIESIRHRSGLLNIYNKSAPSNPGEPDIRYVICLFPYVS